MGVWFGGHCSCGQFSALSRIRSAAENSDMASGSFDLLRRQGLVGLYLPRDVKASLTDSLKAEFDRPPDSHEQKRGARSSKLNLAL
jgi:hypothetical protein